MLENKKVKIIRRRLVNEINLVVLMYSSKFLKEDKALGIIFTS